MGFFTDQIADLFERARQCYADARACDNADIKRRLVVMADDYFRQAKEMQRKQERWLDKQSNKHVFLDLRAAPLHILWRSPPRRATGLARARACQASPLRLPALDPDQCGSLSGSYSWSLSSSLNSEAAVCFFNIFRKKTEAEQRAEIEQVAQETGMSVNDVRTLAMLGIHGAIPLRRRMSVLNIDLDRFSRDEPAIFCELQKSCSRCQSHEACLRDLALDAIDPTRVTWRDYCLNAAALNMLSALACCSHESSEAQKKEQC